MESQGLLKPQGVQVPAAELEMDEAVAGMPVIPINEFTYFILSEDGKSYDLHFDSYLTEGLGSSIMGALRGAVGFFKRVFGKWWTGDPRQKALIMQQYRKDPKAAQAALLAHHQKAGMTPEQAQKQAAGDMQKLAGEMKSRSVLHKAASAMKSAKSGQPVPDVDQHFAAIKKMNQANDKAKELEQQGIEPEQATSKVVSMLGKVAKAPGVIGDIVGAIHNSMKGQPPEPDLRHLERAAKAGAAPTSKVTTPPAPAPAAAAASAAPAEPAKVSLPELPNAQAAAAAAPAPAPAAAAPAGQEQKAPPSPDENVPPKPGEAHGAETGPEYETLDGKKVKDGQKLNGFDSKGNPVSGTVTVNKNPKFPTGAILVSSKGDTSWPLGSISVKPPKPAEAPAEAPAPEAAPAQQTPPATDTMANPPSQDPNAEPLAGSARAEHFQKRIAAIQELLKTEQDPMRQKQLKAALSAAQDEVKDAMTQAQQPVSAPAKPQKNFQVPGNESVSIAVLKGTTMLMEKSMKGFDAMDLLESLIGGGKVEGVKPTLMTIKANGSKLNIPIHARSL